MNKLLLAPLLILGVSVFLTSCNKSSTTEQGQAKAETDKAATDKVAADKAASSQETKGQDPPTIQDDLKALAGDKETTWELSKKDAQGNTIRLTFYRDKDGTPKFGRLWVISENSAAKSAAAAGFEFKVEEKDKRRFLNATVIGIRCTLGLKATRVRTA